MENSIGAVHDLSKSASVAMANSKLGVDNNVLALKLSQSSFSFKFCGLNNGI